MKAAALVLVGAISCAQVSTKAKERYEVMDQLWKENASRSEVIKYFGNSFERDEQGIVYRPAQSRSSIDSAHYFDQNDKLNEQVILLVESDLQKMKDRLKCSWDIRKEVLNRPHTVRTIEFGKCLSRNIQYEFRPVSSLYEIRWKR